MPSRPADFDFECQDTKRDPYPLLSSLRQTEPIFYSERHGAWFLLAFREVRDALRSPHLSNRRAPLYETGAAGDPDDLRRLVDFSKKMVHMRDRLSHTAVRRSLNLGHSALERRWPQQESAIRRLASKVATRRRFDLVADFAAPLPTRVLALTLGIPQQDQARLGRWCEAFNRFTNAEHGGSSKCLRQAAGAVAGFEAYFRRLCKTRAIEPGNDLLSLMLPALAEGILSGDEWIAQAVAVLVTGHTATRHQLTNGVHALLRHPEAIRELRENPHLLDGAIDEICRYDPAIPFLDRLVTEDFEIGGQPLRAGQRVYLGIAAANRDPARFPSPEHFDIHREETSHLAFGGGRHHCFGAGLARKMLTTAIGELLRLPNFDLDPQHPPVRTFGPTHRGFRSMPMRRCLAAR